MRRADLVHTVREQLKRYPPPYAAHYGVVPPPPFEGAITLGDIAARHQAAIEAMAQIDLMAAQFRDPYILSRVLPRREAVSSSAIEGTNSTLDELLSTEETAEAGGTGDTVQVRDYALALDDVLPLARQEGPDLMTCQLVQKLHRAVMRGNRDYRDQPGDLRTVVVWIGGGDIAYSTYNPTPPEDIAACLEQTMAYMRGNGPQTVAQTVIQRMAVAHAHFEAVHPFRDGNGRVGRLLLPVMMAAEGRTPLYLSPYIAAHKETYYEALKAAQQRLDLPAMIGFLSDAIVGTAAELMTTRTALSAVQEIWRNRRKFRSNSAALRALDVLPYYPVLTVARLAAELTVTYRAAAQGIEQLEEAGILQERTGYNRNRIFVAPEILAILNRPFGTEPRLPGETV